MGGKGEGKTGKSHETWIIVLNGTKNVKGKFMIKIAKKNSYAKVSEIHQHIKKY